MHDDAALPAMEQQQQRPPNGALYLVPTPLDFGLGARTEIAAQLPLGTLIRAANISHWMCENTKSARAFLQRVHVVAPLKQPLPTQHMWELPHDTRKKGDHDFRSDASFATASGHTFATPFLQQALRGHDIGLLSEAGLPAVADPGSSVVAQAHRLGIPVVPLAGSSAIVLALAASGLHGQRFSFHGYLPQDSDKRQQALQRLEHASTQQGGSSQIFMDTPYRNQALLSACLHSLQPQTQLAVCAGLLSPQPHIASRSIQEWRSGLGLAPESLTKLPAIFILQTATQAARQRSPCKPSNRPGSLRSPGPRGEPHTPR